MLRRMLAIIGVLWVVSLAVAGTWTSNNFLYKPSLGARGEGEKNTFDAGLDRIDARLSKEIWVGDPKYGATLQAAVTAIGAANVILRVPAGTHSLADDLAIPANVTLKVERGAVLAVPTGKTLTLNAVPEAGRYQIFSCTGTGKVVLANPKEVYPEWWGDTTAAMQAAVNTGKLVKLQAKTYAIGQIAGVSNGGLEGCGYETVLSATGLTDGTAQVVLDNVTNFSIKALKIDGGSNNATTGTFNHCMGLEITGNSSNISLDRVWIYDAHRFGLYIHPDTGDTIEGVNVSNLKVELGCDSNQILIGTNTGQTGTVRNINLNNIILKNGKCDAIGIWRATSTGTVEDININNLHIYNWGTAATGMGIWGHAGTKVNVSNFTLNTGSNGHGIHLENVAGWTFNNGNIYGVPAPYYGINVAIATQDVTFNNILIDGNNVSTRGVLVASTNVNTLVNNVIAKNNVSNGFYVGGAGTKLINCHAYGTGGAGDGFLIIGATDYNVTNMQVVNCSTDNSASNGARLNTYIDSVFFKNCNFKGLLNGLTYSGNQNQYAHGEIAYVKLREAVAAGTDYIVPVFFAPAAYNGIIITKVYLMFGANIAQSDTDYNTYTLQRRDSAGANPTTMVSATTKATGGLAFNANKAVSLGNVSYVQLTAATPQISLSKTHTNAGQAEADGVLVIEYVTY